MKDNKLIAEFMGMKYSDERSFNDGEWTHSIHSLCLFQTSWDWLMTVVEKIEGLRDENGNAYRFTIDMCNAHIEGTDIEILGGSHKIDTTYKAVVEFIKMHNLNVVRESDNWELSTNELKELLTNRGFYTGNLWQVEDVKGIFKCDDDEAQDVLDSALTNEETMNQIWFAVRFHADEYGLKELKNYKTI